MKKDTSPDSACAKLAESTNRLACVLLNEDTELIEGPAESLEALGEILIAQARFQKDCSFDLHPRGPGNAIFTVGSTHGICIHRTPCSHTPASWSK